MSAYSVTGTVLSIEEAKFVKCLGVEEVRHQYF